MRAKLCWNCKKLCECDRAFPSGRPRSKNECEDFEPLPPEPPRITKKEIAAILDCSLRKITEIIRMENGANFILKALANNGIHAIYEYENNKIFFYREENRNERKQKQS